MRSALIAAVLAGAAPARSAAQSVSELVGRLDAKQAGVRGAAYRTLLRTLPKSAVALLVQRLPRFGVSGQVYGVLLLQRYPYKLARTAFVRLEGTSPSYLALACRVVRYRAGHAGDLAPIVDSLAAPGIGVAARAAMVRKLAGLRDPRVRARVRELVKPGVAFGLLVPTLDYLWATDDSEVAPLLSALLAAKQTRGHAAALAAAAGVCWGAEGSAERLAAMIERLGVVHAAVWSFVGRAVELPPPVLAAIAVHARKTENIASLTRATSALIARNAPQTIATLREIARLADEKRAEVGYRKLAEVPGQLRPRDLREMLDSTPPRLRLFAADILRRRDDYSGLRQVLALARQPGEQRREAFRVLSRFRISSVVQPLIGALNDNDALVRTEAYRGLATLLPRLFPYRRFDLARTGYAPGAPAAERTAAARVIADWWLANASSRF